jgi:hypothetical protein
MLKINKIALLLFMLIGQINVFPQFYDLHIQNQKDYKILNRKVQRSFKCSRLFSRKDTTLKLFVTFRLHTTGTISKEEYTDGSFLEKLTYYYRDYNDKNKDYFIEPKRMVAGNFSVVSKEKAVAIFYYPYGRFVSDKKFYELELKGSNGNNSYAEYCENRKNQSSKFPHSKELLNYIWDKGNLFIFRMEEKHYDTYFIINEQLEIFVFFKESDEQYKVLPIKEFIDKYWDRFFKEKGGMLTD